MTTYDYERLWFDEITTEGKFPRGSIAMEVVFKDDGGKQYVWTPKWEEMQKLYATAERVEEVNEGGGEDLQRLKALQRFSGPTLTRLANCIDHHTSLNGIRKEFADGAVRTGDTADDSKVIRLVSSVRWSVGWGFGGVLHISDHASLTASSRSDLRCAGVRGS